MPNPAEIFPDPSLRERLQKLGIPPQHHSMQALTDMMPTEFQGELFDNSPADTLADMLIYLIGKGIIQPPMSVTEAMESFASGAHVCQFYSSKEDLAALLAPYFKSGLERNELCLYIAADHFTGEDARRAFEQSIPGFREFLAAGRFQITDYKAFYLAETGRLRPPDEIVADVISAERESLKKGFSGMRGAGDMSWVQKADWNRFVEYETKLNAALPNTRVIGLCAYCIDVCGVEEMSDAAHSHLHVGSKRNEWYHKIKKTPFIEALLSQLKRRAA